MCVWSFWWDRCLGGLRKIQQKNIAWTNIAERAFPTICDSLWYCRGLEMPYARVLRRFEVSLSWRLSADRYATLIENLGEYMKNTTWTTDSAPTGLLEIETKCAWNERGDSAREVRSWLVYFMSLGVACCMSYRLEPTYICRVTEGLNRPSSYWWRLF